MASQSYDCSSCIHEHLPSHIEPCRNCVNGKFYAVRVPDTLRVQGTYRCDCVELEHRIAIANRFALAVKPLIDELRKNFPEHPAVRAFDEYAEVTIGGTISAGILKMEGGRECSE